MRIAMWSGPRNLSTAMMYAFDARSDCAVWDEPFYAAFLAKTDLDHPMQQEILDAGEQDAAVVAARCVGKVPKNRDIFYQKHMTQHMVPEFDRGWINNVTNVFLTRHPAKVLASYKAKRESATLNDIGFWQQEEIFKQVADSLGKAPVVIDSDDILFDPKTALRRLCSAVGLQFQHQMLEWPLGPNPSDSAWAPHRYKSVWESTGFSKNPLSEPSTADLESEILSQAMKSYEYLSEHRI